MDSLNAEELPLPFLKFSCEDLQLLHWNHLAQDALRTNLSTSNTFQDVFALEDKRSLQTILKLDHVLSKDQSFKYSIKLKSCGSAFSMLILSEDLMPRAKGADALKLADILTTLQRTQNPSRSLLQRLITHIPIMTFVASTAGELLYISPQFLDYTGFKSEEALQMANWFPLFHPDDLPDALAGFNHAMQTGEPLSIEYRIKRKDGVWIWHEARGVLTDSDLGEQFWCCTINDIEESKRATDEFQQRKDRVDTLLETAGVFLFLVDQNFCITFFDGSAKLMLYFDRDCVGKQLYNVCEKDGAIREVVSRAIDTRTSCMSSPSMHIVDGQETWYRHHVTPIFEGDQMITLKIVGAEVTHHYKLEEALINSEVEHKASAAAAIEASRLKTMFVANVSHEIRTPLAIVLSASQLLAQDVGLAAEHRDLVVQISRAGEFLMELIGDVLDVGKIEAGKLELDPKPFYISQIHQDLDALSLLHKNSNVSLMSNIGNYYSGQLYGDIVRIRQVVTNIIGNSFKFCPEGNIWFNLSQEAETPSEVTLVFKVVDEGIGIQQSDIETLFKPFRQVDSSSIRSRGGSGLGLALCKSLVELMNGEIDLISEYSQGTTVSVRLKFQKLDTSLQRTTSPASNIPTQSNGTICTGGKSVKILLAEDNQVLQSLLMKMLKKMKFEPTAVDDGRAAIEAAGRTEYDLCLLDIQMPYIDGVEACRFLRASPDPHVRSMPIIALTASAVKGDLESCLAAGFSAYLSKPVRSEQLEAVIRQHLAPKSS